MCKQLDDEFLEMARRFKLKAGSTMAFTLMQNLQLTVANVGDSSAMLLKKSGEVQKLTVDQTPGRSDEYNRIVRNNGFVTMRDNVARVDGSLAVSRAIGDIQHK